VSDRGKITYFRGKFLTEMTREELIEAVEFLGTAYHRQLESSGRERNFWRDLVKAKRARACPMPPPDNPIARHQY
jgi:hypothetical protein